MSEEIEPTMASTPMTVTSTVEKGQLKGPEFEPPQASISRIIKQVLPENIQVTKDARAAFTRAAGIFIFYLTSCANDYAKDSKRSTIMKGDVLNALKELDFDEFVPPLEAFLDQYAKEQEDKKRTTKKSKDESNNDGTVTMETNEDEEGNDEEEDNDEDNDANEEES